MRVDKERFAQVVQAIDSLSVLDGQYTFDTFCKEKGLYSKGVKERANDIFIACPFHNDKDPSLSIREDRRSFRCFGCGVSGNYLNFITLYDKECLGLDTNVYQKANELLKNDASLQNRVGFSSIFRNSTGLEDYEQLNFKRFKLKQSAPTSYLELASKLQRDGVTNEQIRLAVTLMQSDIPPEVIYDQVKSTGKVVINKKYSIADLEEA